MKIFSIPDVDRFLNLVGQSQGDVILHLPDGSQVDLKQNHTARQLFQITPPGKSGLHFSLSDSSDALAFIRYMMTANISH